MISHHTRVLHELVVPIQPGLEARDPLQLAQHMGCGLKQLPGVLEVWLAPSGDYALVDLDANRGNIHQVLGWISAHGFKHGEVQITTYFRRRAS